MLAACALVDGARAASPASLTERTEAMVGVSAETPAINSLSATDALASFIRKPGLADGGRASRLTENRSNVCRFANVTNCAPR